MIEAMVDAVLVVDAEGRISLCNTAASQITGYTREQLRELPIGKLLVDDGSGLRTVVRRRIEDGSVLHRDESWFVTKSGERVPVSITGSPVLDERGTVQGIVIVARDVRELRQLLEQTRESLLLAERRATLGTLAGGVGHELRNIAQIQVAAIDELAAALAAGEDVTELARSILPDLERVSEHVTLHGQRLMQLARPGPDHVAPLDLNAVVRDVAMMLRGAGKIRHEHVVELRLSAEPVTVTVNRTRIEQILVNLLVNAVDAIGDATGTITITVRASGKRVTCAVSDTGCGIPADALESVFQPFFTTKPAEHGTGLGLSVARTIAQSYGGNLTVTSTVGRGTTFTFELPG